MTPFVFGDSHVYGLAGSNVSKLTFIDGWHLLGIGGATAHNLCKNNSRTGAGQTIKYILDYYDGPKAIYLMFGDVDCVDHIAGVVDFHVGIAESIERYRSFVTDISMRSDVVAVTVCRVFPKTSFHYFQGQSADQIRSTVDSWNANLGDSLDTHSILLGDNGFLATNFAHSMTDVGERHLSKSGSLTVWDVLKSHFAARSGTEALS